MEVKISIVIPVYNTEKYLERCLNSVINQEIQELQIICVDDNSTDESRTILRRYASIDNRIEIFYNKRNRGSGYTKNLGLSKCKGKYILFLDSDDWIKQGALEELYSIAEKEQSDVVYFGMEHLNEESNEILREKYFGNNAKYSNYSDGKTFFMHMIEAGYFRTGSRNFVRRDILYKSNIGFSEAMINDDLEFTVLLFSNCKKVTYLREAKYVYFHRSYNSSTNRSQTGLFWAQYFIKAESVLKSLENQNEYKKYITFLNNFLLSFIIDAFDMLNKEEQKNFLQLLKSNNRLVFFERQINKGKSYSKYYKIADEELSALKREKGIYIYGAGVYGRDLYQFLKYNEVPIKGFIVSENTNNICNIDDKKIQLLKDIDRSETIILGVSIKYISEISKNLKINNYSNIIKFKMREAFR